jgi:hypothetical protein
MLNQPIDILNAHPIRKNIVQKEAFRADVQAYIRELGYDVHMEACGKHGQNIVFGNSETAEYLITAHYDTPATIGIPNTCTPCNGLLSWLKYLASVALGACSSAGTFLLISEGYAIPGILLMGALVVFLYLMRNGPANVNNANDNTSGVVTLLEIARTLPTAHRSKVCFVLFDLEEKGTKGSSAYRKTHKAATEKQVILNLDCVGDGDHILLMPTKKVRKDAKLIAKLRYLGGWFGNKQILVVDKGFCSYNSDHKNFPLAVGVGAFHKKKGKGYVLDKIHTKYDTNLEITNVNLLRAALTTLICGDAVK